MNIKCTLLKLLMISLTLFSIWGCALGMKPSKTQVKVSNTVSTVDKTNSDKDQVKDSMTVTLTQDFKWDNE